MYENGVYMHVDVLWYLAHEQAKQSSAAFGRCSRDRNENL
jgi:hypothetical protein